VAAAVVVDIALVEAVSGIAFFPAAVIVEIAVRLAVPACAVPTTTSGTNPNSVAAPSNRKSCTPVPFA